MISRDKIAELRKLEANATQGPWTTCEGGKRTVHVSQEKCDNLCHLVFDNKIENYSEEFCATVNADAALIAEVRNALPDLLDTLEALWKVAEAAKSALECLHNGLPCCMDNCEGKIVEALAALDEDKGRRS